MHSFEDTSYSMSYFLSVFTCMVGLGMSEIDIDLCQVLSTAIQPIYTRSRKLLCKLLVFGASPRVF